ncbi:hypothetical protein D3C72_1566910 [compost metagenome]
MKINQSAVYATRTVAPYHQGDYYYTRSKDSKIVNVFHLSQGDTYQQPNEYVFQVPDNFKVKKVTILGHKGRLDWSQRDNQITLRSPGTRFNYATAIQLQSK